MASFQEPRGKGGRRLQGKYLTFRLGNEEYGVEVLKVREISGLMSITPVPRTPDYIRGLINRRGKVIPVIDLRRRFGMGGVEETEQACIIVVEILCGGEAAEVGLLVDGVIEVTEIREGDIQESLSLGSGVNTDFILGFAKGRGSVKILLNLETILTEKETAGATSQGPALEQDAAETTSTG